MCNGAEEKQAHSCDPYGLRVQEQPLFLVCSSTGKRERRMFVLYAPALFSHRSKKKLILEQTKNRGCS